MSAADGIAPPTVASPPAAPPEEIVGFYIALALAVVGVPSVIIALLVVAGAIERYRDNLAAHATKRSWVSRRIGRSRQMQAANRGGAQGDLRVRVHNFLYGGRKAKWGSRWDLLQALLAALSCVIYIVGTYYPATQCTTLPPQVELPFELISAVLFSADYVLHLFLATRRIRHVLSPVALAELLTILPSFIMAASQHTACGSSTFAFFRFLRLARFMRIVRLSRFMRSQDSDSFVHQVSVLGVTCICIILVAACAFQWAEDLVAVNEGEQLQFHEAFYYMTIEVLGRPRLPASSAPGFVIATLVVMVVVIIVPWRLVRIVEALRQQSRYTRERYVPELAPQARHVILAGHVTCAREEPPSAAACAVPPAEGSPAASPPSPL